jgi:hypothetical protein
LKKDMNIELCYLKLSIENSTHKETVDKDSQSHVLGYGLELNMQKHLLKKGDLLGLSELLIRKQPVNGSPVYPGEHVQIGLWFLT